MREFIKVFIISTFLGMSMLYGASSPFEFMSNALLDIFSSHVAYILSFLIIIGGVIAVFYNNANWLLVSISCIVCVMIIFKAPTLVKDIAILAPTYNPQKGIW